MTPTRDGMQKEPDGSQTRCFTPLRGTAIADCHISTGTAIISCRALPPEKTIDGCYIIPGKKANCLCPSITPGKKSLCYVIPERKKGESTQSLIRRGAILSAIRINLDVWLAKRQLQQWITTISYAQFRAILAESSADVWEMINAIPDGMQKERLITMYAHETMWLDACKRVGGLEGNGPLNGKIVVTEATPIKANIGAIKCWYINSRGEPDYDYAGKNSIH